LKVGIIQSNYVPWRGYFDFIDEVDLFIFHDDLQYTKGDWRNRNKIKTPKGLVWLTVPVKYEQTSQRICDTRIDYSQKWREKHLDRFRANYAKTAFFVDAMTLWEEGLSCEDLTISQVNIRLIKLISSYLGIQTPLALSSECAATGTKTDRLIQLLRKAGATTYLSGPSAKAYLNENLFRDHAIRLEYKNYDYPTYPQPWGEFVGMVSVLDLIANTGRKARDYLKSQTPNTVAVG
jgi:hypothetical protein